MSLWSSLVDGATAAAADLFDSVSVAPPVVDHHPPAPAPAPAPGLAPASPDVVASNAADAARVPDPAKIKADVDTLIKADGLLTVDKDKMLEAMRGKNPAEVAEMRRQFEVATGKKLDDFVRSSMQSGLSFGKNNEAAEAEAILSGDRIGAAVAGLEQAANGGMTGFGTDEDKIHAILESFKDDPAARKAIEERYARTHGGASLRSMIDSEMSSGADGKVATKLLDGDAVGADAERLEEARSGILGTGIKIGGWGTDEEAIHKVLAKGSYQTDENTKREMVKLPTTDPRRIAFEAQEQKKAKALERLTAQAGGAEALEADLSDDDLKLTQALLRRSNLGAEAVRAHMAMDGMGTSNAKLFGVLEGKDKDQQAALSAHYKELYGESLDVRIHDEMEGEGWMSGAADMDYRKAMMLRSNGGKLTDEFALLHAVTGIGTDTDAIKKVLKGKSPEEIRSISLRYAKLTGQPLDENKLLEDLQDDLSGRDSFDILGKSGHGGLLEGDIDKMQLSEKEKIALKAQRAREALEFETDGVGGWFARHVDTTGLNQVEMLELQTKKMEALSLKAAQTNDPAVLAALGKEARERQGFHQTAVQGVRANVDSVTDAAATGAAIAAGIAVTVATGGPGGAAVAPWFASMLGEVGVTSAAGLSFAASAASAAAGGAATMGTKRLFKGAGYGSEDAGVDAVMTLGQIAISGGMKIPIGEAALPAGALGNALEEAGESGMKRAVGQMMTESAIKNGFAEKGLEGAIGNLVKKGMDPERLPQLLQFMATTTADGALKSGGKMVLAETIQSMMTEAAIGGVKGGLEKGVLGNLLDERNWNGKNDWHDMLDKALLGAAGGAAGGAFSKGATGSGELSKMMAGSKLMAGSGFEFGPDSVWGKAMLGRGGGMPVFLTGTILGAAGGAMGSVAKDLVNPKTYEAGGGWNALRNAAFGMAGGAAGGGYGAVKRDLGEKFTARQGEKLLGGVGARVVDGKIIFADGRTITPRAFDGLPRPIGGDVKTLGKLAGFLNTGNPVDGGLGVDPANLPPELRDADFLYELLKRGFDADVRNQEKST